MVTVHVAKPSSICSRHLTTIYSFVPIIIGQYIAEFFQANMHRGIARLKVILESTGGTPKARHFRAIKILTLGQMHFLPVQSMEHLKKGSVAAQVFNRFSAICRDIQNTRSDILSLKHGRGPQ
jgi:hypothetical protein